MNVISLPMEHFQSPQELFHVFVHSRSNWNLAGSNQRKTSRSKQRTKNKLKTHMTYLRTQTYFRRSRETTAGNTSAFAGNRTWATLVGRCHHCATPVPPCSWDINILGGRQPVDLSGIIPFQSTAWAIKLRRVSKMRNLLHG